jgi:hypothetical protein
MIQRSQNAGHHKDQKKEQEKYLARQPIEEEEMYDLVDEDDPPKKCIHPDCDVRAVYVSPGDLCVDHWMQWWNDGENERDEGFWKELLKRG